MYKEVFDMHQHSNITTINV